MTLSDKIGGIMVGLPQGMIPVPDVKEFIRDIQFWAHIDLGEQTLTIDCDKFKELAGDKLITKQEEKHGI